MAAKYEQKCNCTVLLLCGIPAAGKTTLAQKLVRELPCGAWHGSIGESLQLRVLHVCFDDFMPQYLQLDVLQEELGDVGTVEDAGTQPAKKVWKQQRRNVMKCTEQLLSILNKFKVQRDDLKNEVDPDVWQNFDKIVSQRSNVSTSDQSDPTRERYLVIVDDNFYYRSMRYEFFQLARKFCCGFGQITVTCSLADAMLRNRTRSHRVADDIIRRMETRLEMPNPDTYSWEACSLVALSSNLETEMANKIPQFVCDLFLHPVMPLWDKDVEECQAASKAANLASLVHQADHVLRKCVAEVMRNAKGMSKQKLKEMSLKANSARRTLLGEIKNGKLQLMLIPSPDDSAFSAAVSSAFHSKV